MNMTNEEGKQDFIDDFKEFDKEEIELKLAKIDTLEREIQWLKIRVNQLEKRVKRLQDQKKE